MSDRLSLDSFAPLVGQTFIGKSSNGFSAELELTEAVSITAHANQPRQDPFSLLFRVAAESGLWQGTLRIEHPEFGSAELFLVPVGEDQKGRYFEALFN
ncbi:MAG: hypothetical protein KDI47_03495 [Gammaproteobacteria bacterium]|nr:hypothetical protein [Gammaproteobacteria bacterium]